eukprot:scaffold305_cov110-Cylindrotheca_fusiformis.AAC.17
MGIKVVIGVFISGFVVSQMLFSASIYNDKLFCDERAILEGDSALPSRIPQQQRKETETLTTAPAIPPKSVDWQMEDPSSSIAQKNTELGSLSIPPFPYHRGVFPPFFLQRPNDFNNRTAWMKEPKCRESADWLRAAASADTQEGGVCRRNNTNCPIYVHTELLLQRNTTMVDYRKEQLPVLSFLATQHPSVTLNILVNEDDYKQPPEWLAILLKHEEYGKRLRLDNWDIETLNADDLPHDFLETFKEAYLNLAVPASRSDVRRYAVMYHYGGLWFDTDTVFLSDVRPLMGYDYVVVADKNKLNNCAIGTMSRHSGMMKRILQQVVHTFKQKNDGKYFRFGPYLFEDIRNDRKKPMPFGVLNACLFDAWGAKAKNEPWWWDFFEKSSHRNMQFFQDRTGPFSYHWHGKWFDEMKPRSIASIIHTNYVKELKLDPVAFRALDEEDWSGAKNHQPFQGPHFRPKNIF